MFKATRNRILAAAALALALASVLAAAAQTQQTTAKCATASVRLNSATPRAGDELTATVGVQSCAADKERVVVQYSYTDPCGNTTVMGSTPIKLEAGEKQDTTVSFLAPAAECAGDFTITAKLSADGKDLNSTSTTFRVSAQ